MTFSLDDRDRRILELLKADAWLSYAQLSEQVNLSASAVQRRVERLIATGVIRGARAEVAAPQTEPPITIFLLAELTDESPDAMQRLGALIVANRVIAEAYYVAGESDVVLKLQLPDMAAYDRFIDTQINASGLVRRFKTLTALRSLAPK